jgi:hypothetical protein
VGTSSLAQKVTLTNGCRVALNISSITSNPPDFTETNTCGTSLAPGGSYVIVAKFTPSQPTAGTAMLTVSDNAIGGSQTVTLNAVGAVTPVTVFPIVLNSGSVSLGKSRTLLVTLANASNQNLTIQPITASPSL